MGNTINTHTNSPTVGCSIRTDWRGAGWLYTVAACRCTGIDTHTARVSMTRSEALKAHRELGRLLRATAPRKRRAR